MIKPQNLKNTFAIVLSLVEMSKIQSIYLRSIKDKEGSTTYLTTTKEQYNQGKL